MKKLIITAMMLLYTVLPIPATQTTQETTLESIELPDAITTGGMPIMDSFKNRKNNVKFSKDPLDLQHLSNILWAASSTEKLVEKEKTPNILNAHNINLYVAYPNAIYKYSSDKHTLDAISKESIISIIGKYPLALMYVANLSMQSKYLAAFDAGFIGQNVYLYAAANDLNTSFLYDVNSYALGQKLNLKLGEEVLFVQLIGNKP